MAAIYELIGRLVVRFIRVRYRRQILIDVVRRTDEAEVAHWMGYPVRFEPRVDGRPMVGRRQALHPGQFHTVPRPTAPRFNQRPIHPSL